MDGQITTFDTPVDDLCARCGDHGQAHGPHSDQVKHHFVPKGGLVQKIVHKVLIGKKCPKIYSNGVYDGVSEAKRVFETGGATYIANHGIYVASRASVPERGQMWRRYRDEHGARIISSWIDEDGQGETEDMSELWDRIHDEVSRCERLVLYAETGDFPLKGALVEVGMALGMGKPVIVCLPGVDLEERSCRPIGSWVNHQMVIRCDNVYQALVNNVDGIRRRFIGGPRSEREDGRCPSCGQAVHDGYGLAYGGGTGIYHYCEDNEGCGWFIKFLDEDDE